MNITSEGELFIINEETGGRSYYEKKYKSSFIYPGGASGPTALVGVDIGYYTVQEVEAIFKPLTTSAELELIQLGRGKTRDAAKEYVTKLQEIKFTWEEAIEVFERWTMPKFTKLTSRVFPEVENLAEPAQAALLSLVFNRGVSLKGDSRKEMLNIRQLVPSKNYRKIADEISSMKRLWSKGNGLLGRRDREAALVLKCA